MAKVKKEIIEAALLGLVDKINATMPNNTYKFIIGGAAGLLSIGNIGKLNEMLNTFADENGLIETENIKCIYESAFKQSDNKLQIELFNKPNSLLSFFVKPITLTITKEDIDQIMKEIEANSVSTNVILNT